MPFWHPKLALFIRNLWPFAENNRPEQQERRGKFFQKPVTWEFPGISRTVSYPGKNQGYRYRYFTFGLFPYWPFFPWPFFTWPIFTWPIFPWPMLLFRLASYSIISWPFFPLPIFFRLHFSPAVIMGQQKGWMW